MSKRSLPTPSGVDKQAPELVLGTEFSEVIGIKSALDSWEGGQA